MRSLRITAGVLILGLITRGLWRRRHRHSGGDHRGAGEQRDGGRREPRGPEGRGLSRRSR